MMTLKGKKLFVILWRRPAHYIHDEWSTMLSVHTKRCHHISSPLNKLLLNVLHILIELAPLSPHVPYYEPSMCPHVPSYVPLYPLNACLCLHYVPYYMVPPTIPSYIGPTFFALIFPHQPPKLSYVPPCPLLCSHWLRLTSIFSTENSKLFNLCGFTFPKNILKEQVVTINQVFKLVFWLNKVKYESKA